VSKKPDTMIPVSLVTGFLGSGKTTFLNRLLQDPGAGKSGVIINEIGDISIDHDLVETQGDDFIILSGGCLCCALRGSIEETIKSLISKHEAGIDRIFIETSGMADPTLIAQTVMASPSLSGRVFLASIVNVFDSLLGPETLNRYREAQLQLASADMVLVSKQDLADADGPGRACAEIKAFNQAAGIIFSAQEAIHALVTDHAPDSSRTGRREATIADTSGSGDPRSGHAAHRGTPYVTASQRFPGELDSASLEWWLDDLFATFGSRILRVKGVLRMHGSAKPVVLQAVQFLVAPPRFMEAWPGGDEQSRLVVIAEDVDETLLQHALRSLAETAAAD